MTSSEVAIDRVAVSMRSVPFSATEDALELKVTAGVPSSSIMSIETEPDAPGAVPDVDEILMTADLFPAKILLSIGSNGSDPVKSPPPMVIQLHPAKVS